MYGALVLPEGVSMARCQQRAGFGRRGVTTDCLARAVANVKKPRKRG